LRVVLAGTIATVVGRFLWDTPRLAAPLLALLLVAIYVVVLVLARELGSNDLALVRRVLKRSA
jgi:hypothetical protein